MANIIHEKKLCVGCGACAAVCPKYWEMGGDGKSHLKNATASGDKFMLVVEAPECNKDAANACPVKCITVEE